MRNAIIIALVFIKLVLAAQPDSLAGRTRARKVVLTTSTAAITAGSLVYLNRAWYSEYNTGRFHLFNDNKEWLQMDKAGHFYTTYQIGRLMMSAFEWAGYNRRQKMILGGAVGFIFMTGVEIMDGFSKGWGYSWGDQLADALGTTLAVGQEMLWNEQRIQVKFSYAPSGLAAYNPSLLGDSPSTRILKDYNAQVYWLSFNPFSMANRETRFPHWLNLAVGYGAYGMIGGHENKLVIENSSGQVLKFSRERRFYLSLDLDLTKIKTKSKFLKSVFSVISVVKIPAPAIGFGKNKVLFSIL